MDFVCITDHDSLDGCLEFLDRYPDAPDFIMGEEVECTFPRARVTRGRDALRVHLGVIGITERIHQEIQPLRQNVFEAAAYLREQDIFFAINHLFFFFHDHLDVRRYASDMLSACGAVETRNGAMLAEHNVLLEQLVRDWSAKPLAQVAGSDAHTLSRIARTYTEAPAQNREEFLSSLKAGLGRVHGEHGSIPVLTAEIYQVVAHYWAALLGFRRDDLRVQRRLFGILFSGCSLPFQFIPALVALVQKRKEMQRVRRYGLSLRPDLHVSSDESASSLAPVSYTAD
jgi:predicted metal-dependent phosphoesterase TrpH